MAGKLGIHLKLYSFIIFLMLKRIPLEKLPNSLQSQILNVSRNHNKIKVGDLVEILYGKPDYKDESNSGNFSIFILKSAGYLYEKIEENADEKSKLKLGRTHIEYSIDDNPLLIPYYLIFSINPLEINRIRKTSRDNNLELWYIS